VSFVLGNASVALVNQSVVSTTIAGYSASHQRAVSEVTTVADGGARFVPGLMAGTLTLRGPQDSVGQSLAAKIAASVGVDNTFIATVCPTGTAVGSFAITVLADISEQGIDASVSDAVGFTATCVADESVDMGFLAHGLTAETATSNGTSIDRGVGVSTTNGGVAALHLTAYSGLTNVAIKIQHSTDNSTWADLQAFTTATAVGAERKFIARGTTVNRYVRTVTTVTGTGSATFLVAFAPR
jgi:hypothetical protein